MALIEGVGDSSFGQGVGFAVQMADNGQTGTNDIFTISTLGYNNTGLLGAGNVKVHGMLCP